MYDRIDSAGEGEGEYATNEVLERAYALGVASVCGDPDEDAYDRLKANSPDTYDESIVELAYEEGRANALQLEAEADDHETVWERLVEREFEWIESADDPTSGLPEAIRPPEEGPTSGLPDRLDLPSFLRRE
jgi:hypothetical protein